MQHVCAGAEKTRNREVGRGDSAGEDATHRPRPNSAKHHRAGRGRQRAQGSGAGIGRWDAGSRGGRGGGPAGRLRGGNTGRGAWKHDFKVEAKYEAQRAIVSPSNLEGGIIASSHIRKKKKKKPYLLLLNCYFHVENNKKMVSVIAQYLL